MEPAQVLRVARRQAGLSQRGMARAAGVPAGTIAAVESGQRQPTAAVLDRLLAAVDLDLVLAHRAPEQDRPAAWGVWLPGRQAPRPLEVLSDDLPAVAPTHLTVTTGAGGGGLVPVGVATTAAVHVASPSRLLLDGVPTDDADGLRTVERLLHRGRGRDDGGRRVPAHRDPDEPDERYRLLTTKSHLGALPDRLDSRAWRVGGSASLPQWTRHHEGRLR